MVIESVLAHHSVTGMPGVGMLHYFLQMQHLAFHHAFHQGQHPLLTITSIVLRIVSTFDRGRQGQVKANLFHLVLRYH